MNHELLDKIALHTGGSHFPAVFHHYQKDYVLNVLSEIQKVLHEVPFDAYAIDFWDDIIKHFQLDNYEIEKLLKSNKESA
jgi:uncharacterized protein YihD (DUF1040 family)